MESHSLDVLKTVYTGRMIEIVYMKGEPKYTGRQGVVELVDDMGQLHGTWGGLAVDPNVDAIKFVY